MNILPRLVRAGFLSLSADLQYPGSKGGTSQQPLHPQARRHGHAYCRRGPAMRKGRRRCQLSGSSNQVTNRPPPPPPPRRQPRNKLKPPAAFRIAARRTQLRRPRPGTIGDLDPDNAVPGPDRDRHRPPGSTRAAGPDRITEDLADQQDGRISARVPRAEYLTDERTGGPRPAPPARQASRSPGPSSPHPPFPGRPAPAALPRETGRAAGGRRDMHAQLSRERQAVHGAASADPCPWPVRGRGPRPWPSMQSRRPLTPLPGPDSRPLYVRGHRDRPPRSAPR